MEIVSIVLKPTIDEGEIATRGYIVVDEATLFGDLSTPIKVELEILPLSGPAVLKSKDCYTFRCELKGSQMAPIASFNEANTQRFKIHAEDLHRFSGFLEDLDNWESDFPGMEG